MRKPLMAAAVAGILGIVPVAGHAANVNAGLCELRGVASFASPIHAAPDSVEYTFAGSLACTGVVANDAPGYVDDLFGGEITAQGVGTVGCAGAASSGSFDATILREPTVRDIWHGNYSTVGVGPATALFAQVITVEHQTSAVEDDPETPEDERVWETQSTDGTTPTLGGGLLTFNDVDATQCVPDSAGLSDVNFGGEIAYAFGS